jgi:hypothetical protein
VLRMARRYRLAYHVPGLIWVENNSEMSKCITEGEVVKYLTYTHEVLLHCAKLTVGISKREDRFRAGMASLQKGDEMLCFNRTQFGRFACLVDVLEPRGDLPPSVHLVFNFFLSAKFVRDRNREAIDFIVRLKYDDNLDFALA